MRFLDLDLDFFLNKNPYYSGAENTRLGSPYKPWSRLRVRRFLEKQCGLSVGTPLLGRTVESHHRVIDFWRSLIESGDLKAPFDVTHIDAHPDLSVRGGLRLAAGMLFIEPGRGCSPLEEEYANSGNYLTYAIAYGWVAHLVWIPLLVTSRSPNQDDVDPGRSGQVKSIAAKGTAGYPPNEVTRPPQPGVPFIVIPWQHFIAAGSFDYMILSKSPGFTPPESDALVPIIEQYMRKM